MTIFKDLLQRRVPQILGIYLGASWAIIEFLDWFIEKFAISPHVSEFALILLASLIPSVLLLAYFHGKPGRDTWTRTEKIGIPANVVGAGLLLIFLFKGKDLGAATSIVSLENEEGETIERVVIKPEFRKKIMLYFLENESGDAALDWLSYGIPDMVYMDLIQDSYMEAYAFTHGEFSRVSLEKAGYADLMGLPLVLEKEIAQNNHLDYFLSGAFTKEDDVYSLNVSLYHTRNGRLVREYHMDHRDLMGLVDQLTVQLKKDMKVPAYHMEEVADMPVAEITTSSLNAYEWYTMGTLEFKLNNDFVRAQEYLNNAARDDPTFSLAHLILYSACLSSNQSEMGSRLFEPIMDHLYKLPEKYQFLARASYFEYNQEFDKQLAVFEMWVELYPEDVEARSELIVLYKARKQIDKAIEQYKDLLELDPEKHSTLESIGSLYVQQGNYGEAEIYYQRYGEQAPDRPEPFRSLGGLYKLLGEFEKARSSINQALLLDPENVSDMLQLGEIEALSGNFTLALPHLQKALELSSNSKEKAAIYARFQSFHEMRGQSKDALSYLHLKLEALEEAYDPLSVIITKLREFDQFVRLENEELIPGTLEALGRELDGLINEFISVGYLYWYLEQEDAEKAEREIERAENLIAELGFEVFRPITLGARA